LGAAHTRWTAEVRRTLAEVEHPQLRKIWDTSDPAVDEIINIGFKDDEGRLVTFHVSDDPEAVLRGIKRRVAWIAAYGAKGRHAELGPGLYASAVPSYWAGRATGQWDFLDRLTWDDVDCLAREVERILEGHRGSGYLTSWELERASTDVARVRSRAYETPKQAAQIGLGRVVDQPYNILWHKPDFLKKCGVRAGTPPRAVRLVLRPGVLLAELRGSHPDPKLLRMLRRMGVSGAFTPFGMGSDAQVVLWDPGDVVQASIVAAR
jgi:hypothetical protein